MPAGFLPAGFLPAGFFAAAFGNGAFAAAFAGFFAVFFAVGVFRDACAGRLLAPCPEGVDTAQEVTERGKQSKKAAFRACLGSAAEPVSYAYSQVWSIQRGRRINAGAVQGKFALRVAPATPPGESVALSHDAAGLLSVRRGGGALKPRHPGSKLYAAAAMRRNGSFQSLHSAQCVYTQSHAYTVKISTTYSYLYNKLSLCLFMKQNRYL